MGETQRSFLPNAGFAVKTTTMHSPRAAKLSAAALLSIAPPAPTLLTLPKGSPVYINITSHAAVEAPMDQMGNSLAGSRPLVSANGLQMSLVVSPPRAPLNTTTSTAAKQSKKLVVEADSVPAASKAANTAAAATQSLTFDAVVHPWALQCCQSSRGFQAQVVELVLSWVEAEGASPEPHDDDDCDDYNIDNSSSKQQQQRARLSRSWQLITHAVYVHGTGSKGDAPVPFLVDNAERQSCPPEQRTSNSSSSTSSSSGSGIKTTATGVPELVQRSMAEPHSLLAAMAQQSSNSSNSVGSADNSSSSGLAGRIQLDIKLPGSSRQHHTNNTTATAIASTASNNTGSSAAVKKAVLIEEVGAVKPAAAKQKAAVPAVKKGFLISTATKKKSAVLYPEGSSEGQGAGSYAKLMSRCKVLFAHYMPSLCH
jgi:hypothetical protein